MKISNFYLAILVGVALFITDTRLHYLPLIIGPIPPIFVISVIVGIIAGQLSRGTLAALATSIFGILLTALVSPVLFPEWYVSDPSIFGILMGSMGESLVFTFEAMFGEVTGWAAFGLIAAVIVLIPSIYFFAIIFGTIGGVIGRLLRRVIKSATGEATKTTPIQAPASDVPPPSEPESSLE